MKENVILITVECLNPRYMNYFGHSKESTPALCELQNESLNFFNCIANSGFTPVAMKAIHTGRVQICREQEDWMQHIDKATLAKTMKAAGYATAGYVGFGHAGSELGFNHGYDTYDEPLPGDDPNRDNKYEWVRYQHDEYNRVNGETIGFHMGNWFVDRMLQFIEDKKEEPFFVSAHYTETHCGAERVIPERYVDEFPDDTPQNQYYDAKIKWFDTEFIAPMIETLKRLDLFDNTHIFITGDHGESFGHHGESVHGLWCYNESMRVPLIIHSPRVTKNKGKIFERPIRSVDIMKTILSLTDVAPLNNIDGADLVHHFEDETEPYDHLIYTESYATCYSGDQRGIIKGRYKYLKKYPPFQLQNMKKDAFYEKEKAVSSPNIQEEEFYDCVADSYETSNLIDSPEHAELVSEFRKTFKEFMGE